MERKRGLAVVGSMLFVALAGGQYLQTTRAESAVMASPLPAPPLPRVAAGTPFPVALTQTKPAPPTTAEPDPAPPAASCPITLDMFANADATLAISLTAPCRPNEGVVVTHAEMGVTYQTTATGALFLDLPALDARGEVRIRFADGTVVDAAAPVPDLAPLHRFALQWIEGDSFNLATDAPVITLGTGATVLPMYAKVVTLPAFDTPLAIEAAVTDTNCGREALGAAFYSESGQVRVADLSLALPDCDSLGGFVVLNNPVANMKLASAE